MTGAAALGARGMARAGAALGFADYRRLLFARVISQVADGLFMALVLQTVVFLPERQSTILGFALATALTLLPFSLVEPFAGVFVDRWRRRRLLVGLPLVRALAALLILPADVENELVYGGMLIVFSAGRLFQATTSAVMPRVLDIADEEAPAQQRGLRRLTDQASFTSSLLFDANTIAAVAGTVALFGGMVAGGWLIEPLGHTFVLVLTCIVWVAAALASSALSCSLPPQPSRALSWRDACVVVLVDLVDGFRRILRTPAALAPILTVAVGQFLQLLVVAVSILVIKESMQAGLVTFSWLLAAGGVGVFVGFATVELVSLRFSNPLLIGVACVLSGVAVVPALVELGAATLSMGAVLLGIAYAWVRVPGDTLAQQAVPDRYRGRVFTVMDLGFNTARVLGALSALVVIPLLGGWGALALAGALFLAWAPVTPLWLGWRREKMLAPAP